MSRRETSEACRVTTVRRLHCEKDAVFRPRPKRPRSAAERVSRGIPRTGPHRFQKFLPGHANSVVEYPDRRRRVMCVREEAECCGPLR